MSAVKIEKKIVGLSVRTDAAEPVQAPVAAPAPVVMAEPTTMSEVIKRPDMLIGTTYKIKPPVGEHAFYVTINDIVLNEGTDHEQQRPFEIFVNSKSMEHYSWVVAMTRLMSAIFRKGGDCTFVVEELKAVFDPKGGYFQSGTGVYMPSLVAEIGAVVERHMKRIGLIKGDALDEHQRALIAEKRKQLEAKTSTTGTAGFPADAALCGKCHHKSVILMDGCATCLNCGDSKCG